MIETLPFIEDIPEDVRLAIVRVLLVFLALLLVWGLRRILTLIIVLPLRRITGRTASTVDDQMIEAAIQPVRWLIIAFAVVFSSAVLEIQGALLNIVQNIGRTLVIVAILLFIYRLIDLLMPSAPMLARITGMKIEERLLPFLRTAIKVFVIALGLVITLQEWGYDVSGLIAGLGLGGLAFSLAAQDTVSNLFGFAALTSDRPFDVGEYIKTPDVEGIVEHVGIRSTRVRQLDQAVVYVPNSILAASAILNWSRLSKRRLDYLLGVTYDATSGDIRVLLHRIREMLTAQEHVDPDSVTVYFVNFGDSALEILVRCYVHIADWSAYTAEQERLHLLVMDIVNDLGMSMAFPSMSLYVENIGDFPGAEPSTPEPKPTLSPRERALMVGYTEKSKQQQPPDEENITGQQDAPD